MISSSISVNKSHNGDNGIQQMRALTPGKKGSALPRMGDSQRGQALMGLLGIVDAKDPYTHGHSLRVTQIAMMIGKVMGFNQGRLRDLYEASCLHDLGKTQVPNNILNKAGWLTEDEMQCMQKHSQVGYDLLCQHPLFGGIASIIQAHHERWDGLGYPFGLVGEAIPLEARIIAIADAFDAMTSDRPYRKGLCHSYGVQEIRSHSGDQFDPLCVEAFCEVVDQILQTPQCSQCTFAAEDNHDGLMHSRKINPSWIVVK